jgi:hypothetical protein
MVRTRKVKITSEFGEFEYLLTVITKNGIEATISGKACAVECGDGDALFLKSKGNCFFPEQVQSGESNPNIPSGEVDCFE